MKKVLISGALAIGLLVLGTGTINSEAAQPDNSSFNIESALVAVQSQKANLFDSQLKGQIESVQAKNQQIVSLNQQLNELMSKNVNGINDNKIYKLKTEIDTLNSNQQTDMVNLQSLSNQRNEAFDVMSNFINKMNQSSSSIIGKYEIAP
ncbi:hypothetical protein [Cytobacillus kochii]|uniref:hypothetical protein n=1 Tax=Cytobacillus kochii TaxID=859143 RepID=UPI0025A0AB1F|nr:hypothetical protein [Cytobacillus kochii]MDM5205336.1 hypothetical protein [Cytobacillus kochii]